MAEWEKLFDLVCSAIAEGKRFCNTQDSCSVCPYNQHEVNCLEAFWTDHLVKNGVKIPVMCKDCQDARKEIALDKREYFMCKHTETCHSGNHYCSYGEMMDK